MEPKPYNIPSSLECPPRLLHLGEHGTVKVACSPPTTPPPPALDVVTSRESAAKSEATPTSGVATSALGLGGRRGRGGLRSGVGRGDLLLRRLLAARPSAEALAGGGDLQWEPVVEPWTGPGRTDLRQPRRRDLLPPLHPAARAPAHLGLQRAPGRAPRAGPRRGHPPAAGPASGSLVGPPRRRDLCPERRDGLLHRLRPLVARLGLGPARAGRRSPQKAGRDRPPPWE